MRRSIGFFFVCVSRTILLSFSFLFLLSPILYPFQIFNLTTPFLPPPAVFSFVVWLFVCLYSSIFLYMYLCCVVWEQCTNITEMVNLIWLSNPATADSYRFTRENERLKTRFRSFAFGRVDCRNSEAVKTSREHSMETTGKKLIVNAQMKLW